MANSKPSAPARRSNFSMLRPTLPDMNFDIDAWSIPADLQIRYRVKVQPVIACRIWSESFIAFISLI